MRFMMSLILGCVLFMTQTIALVHATQTQGNAGFYGQDFRLQVAEELNNRGAYLQDISDRQGLEKANQEFEHIAQANLQLQWGNVQRGINDLSEGEATTELANIQRNLNYFSPDFLDQGEKILSLISDRTQTAKERIFKLFDFLSFEKVEQQMDQIKLKASHVGYKKAFSDMADVLRSRTITDDRNMFIAAFAILLLFAILPYPINFIFFLLVAVL